VLFGSHCSGGIKRALDHAAELGADSVQLFAQSPRAWRFPEHDPADLERFRERRVELGLGGVFVHALYLINLGSPRDEIYDKSVATLRQTVATATAIEADGVVVHVGSHLGAGLETGLGRAVPALAQVLELTSDRTWLLLENSAGAGDTIGRSVEELAELHERLGHHRRLGLCLDSCHLFASGYDVGDPEEVARVVGQVDSTIGLARLRALHVNDSAAPLGSNRDRHANVGDGLIGERLGAFLAHPSVQHLPALLEVPGPDGHGPDAAEIRKLRELHARWAKPKRKAATSPRRGRRAGR
jgi:deoxyribonuclease IV